MVFNLICDVVVCDQLDWLEVAMDWIVSWLVGWRVFGSFLSLIGTIGIGWMSRRVGPDA